MVTWLTWSKEERLQTLLMYISSHATDAVGILPAPAPYHPHPSHRLKTYRLYEKFVSSNSVADMYKGSNDRPRTGSFFASAVLTVGPFWKHQVIR